MPADTDTSVVLSGVADTSARAVEALMASFPSETLREAVQMMATANSIAVAGLNQAFPIAAYLADGLARRKFRCRLLGEFDHVEIKYMSAMCAADVLVGISFGNGTCPVVDMASVARDRRVGVLGITDSAASPLTRHSDRYLVVHSPKRHGILPLAPHIVLIQSLLAALEDERRR